MVGGDLGSGLVLRVLSGGGLDGVLRGPGWLGLLLHGLVLVGRSGGLAALLAVLVGGVRGTGAGGGRLGETACGDGQGCPDECDHRDPDSGAVYPVGAGVGTHGRPFSRRGDAGMQWKLGLYRTYLCDDSDCQAGYVIAT